LQREVLWRIATRNIGLKNSGIDLPTVLNTIAMAVQKESEPKRNGRKKIKREKLLNPLGSEHGFLNR
jgi:hypothetical protein